MFKWIDKQDDIDFVLAKDINDIAHSVIELEKTAVKVVDQTYTPDSENAQSGKAVAKAVAIEQKRSDNTFSNALRGSKSDTAMLLDDISPVTHDMGVKVRGKNLFDKSIPYGDYTFIERGYSYLSIYVGSGSNVTVSLKQKHDIGLGGYFFCVAYKANTNIFPIDSHMKWLYYSANTALCKKSVTMISEDGYVSLFMNPDAYNSFKNEIMVEIGTTATAYTPYVPDLTAVKVIKSNASGEAVAEYTPTADGIVEGVTSLYPNTTLMTDTEGVLIDCEYNRDINKAFAALEAAIATNNS